ncbi:Rv1355c family protein [Algoriphagus aquimarinus]|uniref:Rv1355c family protein n=1 Tax=Algoriphagus aquimarinus TaxID=237018 RepID=A0A5C7AGE3_9BACT|nr:Rv1355c family protein [Algoriphagus aquimarinus]TXE06979.1 Rv1355c family protein [Algoriphagus aquimarinus]
MLPSSQFDFHRQISPIIYQLNDLQDILKVKELLDSPYVRAVDQLNSQMAELIKAKNPAKSFSDLELAALVSDFFRENDREKYGAWVFFPWKNILVRLLPEEEFVLVRTQRNNYKITSKEQEELRKKKIGIIGLSVGQSIAFAIALERGCGELRLADFDTLELSNLNRIKAGVTDLGVEKVVIAAREISEIDPYLKITVFRDGISEENIGDFLSGGGDLDLLIDECDSLDIKALAREKAKAKRIPVLMETSDRGMLDVERFDLEPNRAIFHGLIGDLKFTDLQGLTSKQKVPMALKITGISTVSTRMKVSLLEVNQTIASWPQLASAVYLGGATVSHASRKLLLGEKIESGRYYVDLDELIKKESEEIPLVSKKSVKATEDFVQHLPAGKYKSTYKLSEEELKYLIQKANTAPSGGNSQPWKWIFDKEGVLHLIHDKDKSESLLDYLGTGSLLAFGAALEIIRLTGANMGLELSIHYQIAQFDEDLIASVLFYSKIDSPYTVLHANLAKGIDLRCTNRKNEERELISPEEIQEFKLLAEDLGVTLEVQDDLGVLEQLAPILGGMDRLRLLHEQGYADFMNEIRWSDKDARDTKDGIDIATLEMGNVERAAIGLVRDPGTVEFFRKNDLGYGLTKISDQTVLTAGAVMMLEADEYTPEAFLKSGAVLQRVWMKANLTGYSVQPISASLFIFHRVNREESTGFNSAEKEQIILFKSQLNTIFNLENQKEEMFMVRINRASDPSMRSFRRDVSESLIIL